MIDNKPFRELCSAIDSFAYNTGRRRSQVFEDLLDYLIYGFCTNAGLPRWDYTEEQNANFRTMLSLWMQAAHEETEKRGWCDIPGNIQQSGIRHGNGLGQFFTPEDVCTLMAEITGPKDGQTVFDPCCGSGRTLLAAYAMSLRDGRAPYCVANDIDEVCTKMTAANFLIHGICGEVSCGNSLAGDYRETAFVVNEHLNDSTSPLHGIPHCRVVPFGETLQGQKLSA